MRARLRPNPGSSRRAAQLPPANSSAGVERNLLPLTKAVAGKPEIDDWEEDVAHRCKGARTASEGSIRVPFTGFSTASTRARRAVTTSRGEVAFYAVPLRP